jgi:hypothetical protein
MQVDDAWSWRPSGARWVATVGRLREQVGRSTPLLALLNSLAQAREILAMRCREPLSLKLCVSDAAFGLLLLRPDGTYATSLDDARAALSVAWSDSPGWDAGRRFLEPPPVGLSQELVYDAVAAIRRVRTHAAAPRPPAARNTPPRPVSAPGTPARYLTDEQKVALNAKYAGRLKPPSASEMGEVASAASNCKMQ